MDVAQEDTLAELKLLVDEKTADRFKVHYVGKAPIGPMWGVETGVV